MAILKSLPGVDYRYVKKVNDKNNHCYLTYNNRDEKSEILKGGVRRLKFDDIRPLLDSDIIILNYISGNDIYLASLEKLRKEYIGSLYVDIHSLTLGRRKNGARFFRSPPGWEQIVAAADYVQMNRQELVILLNDKSGKISQREVKSKFIRFLNILERRNISFKNKVFIITRGSRGCMLAWFHSGNIKWEYVEPAAILKKGDTTGCGDSFSAGFIAGLMKSDNLIECARLANRAGRDCIKANSD
jgi:sugar/nucleoside kinase (ribokinase family)